MNRRFIVFYTLVLSFFAFSCGQDANKSENKTDSVIVSEQDENETNRIAEDRTDNEVKTDDESIVLEDFDVSKFDTAQYVFELSFQRLKYKNFEGGSGYTNIFFEDDEGHEILMEEMAENVKLPEANAVCMVVYKRKHGEPGGVGNGESREYFHLLNVQALPEMTAEVKKMLEMKEKMQPRVQKYYDLGNKNIKKAAGGKEPGNFTYEQFSKMVDEHKKNNKFTIVADISGFYPAKKAMPVFAEFIGQDNEFEGVRPNYRYYFNNGFIYNGIFGGGELVHLKGFSPLHNGLKSGMNTSEVEAILGVPLVPDKNTLVYADASYSECGGGADIYPAIFLFFEDERLTEICVSWRVQECY